MLSWLKWSETCWMRRIHSGNIRFTRRLPNLPTDGVSATLFSEVGCNSLKSVHLIYPFLDWLWGRPEEIGPLNAKTSHSGEVEDLSLPSSSRPHVQLFFLGMGRVAQLMTDTSRIKTRNNCRNVCTPFFCFRTYALKINNSQALHPS